MRELRPFKLPQLVEDRVNENKIDTSESAPIGHGLYLSTSFTPSEDLSSAPTTPTVSLRLHSRFPSSASSLASSPTMRESIDGFGSQKTPLSDVKEEPLEREESFQMVESLNIISKGRSLTVFLDLWTRKSTARRLYFIIRFVVNTNLRSRFYDWVGQKFQV